MIFITLGSQKFQFNLLLKAVDDLIERRIIQDEVYAQTGYSTYKPRHYKSEAFLDRQDFLSMEGRADIVITHGGTGAIIGAVKQGKKVIAVPRLAKYKEHVDDHQLQIIKQFEEMNLIYTCMNCDELDKAIKEVQERTYNSYISNTHSIIASLERFIEGI